MGVALADHASAKQSAFDMVALHRRFRRERKRRTMITQAGQFGHPNAPCVPPYTVGPNQCKLSIAGRANEEI